MQGSDAMVVLAPQQGLGTCSLGTCELAVWCAGKAGLDLAALSFLCPGTGVWLLSEHKDWK